MHSKACSIDDANVHARASVCDALLHAHNGACGAHGRLCGTADVAKQLGPAKALQTRDAPLQTIVAVSMLTPALIVVRVYFCARRRWCAHVLLM